MYNMDTELRGDRVKLLREALDLTQQQLANLCEVTRPQITNIESHKSGATLRLLVTLTTNLRTTSDYLLGLSDNPGAKWEQRIERVKRLSPVQD